MAEIKRPKKKVTRKPPQFSETKNNLQKEEKEKLVNLNLSVTSDFRKELKQFALDNDTSVTQLIRDMFVFYKEKHI